MNQWLWLKTAIFALILFSCQWLEIDDWALLEWNLFSWKRPLQGYATNRVAVVWLWVDHQWLMGEQSQPSLPESGCSKGIILLGVRLQCLDTTPESGRCDTACRPAWTLHDLDQDRCVFRSWAPLRCPLENLQTFIKQGAAPVLLATNRHWSFSRIPHAAWTAHRCLSPRNGSCPGRARRWGMSGCSGCRRCSQSLWKCSQDEAAWMVTHQTRPPSVSPCSISWCSGASFSQWTRMFFRQFWPQFSFNYGCMAKLRCRQW